MSRRFNPKQFSALSVPRPDILGPTVKTIMPQSGRMTSTPSTNPAPQPAPQYVNLSPEIKTEFDDLRRKYAACDTDRKQQVQIIKQMENDLGKLNASREADSKRCRELETGLRNKLDGVTRDLDICRKQLNEAHNLNIKLQAEISSIIIDAARNVPDPNRIYAELMKSNDKLSAFNRDLNTQLAACTQNLETCEAENSKLQKIIKEGSYDEAHKEQISELKDQIATHKLMRGLLDIEIDGLKKQIESLKSEKQQVENNLQSCLASKDTLYMQITDMAIKLKELDPRMEVEQKHWNKARIAPRKKIKHVVYNDTF